MLARHSIVPGDNGTALAVLCQPQHGPHAGRLKKEIWFKTGFLKELVNDHSHGGVFLYQGEKLIPELFQGYLRVLAGFLGFPVGQGMGFWKTQVKWFI